MNPTATTIPEEHKPRSLDWFVENWQPGADIESDLHRLQELLNQPSLRYQAWKTNVKRKPATYGIGWDAKGKCPLQLSTNSFILEVTRQDHETIVIDVLEPKSFRNLYSYNLIPSQLRDTRNNLFSQTKAFNNLLNIWMEYTPAKPYDPFDL
jgi:hypothetical protein